MEAVEQFVEGLFRSVYLPGKSLDQILDDFLHTDSGSSELNGVSICVRQDTVQVENENLPPLVVSRQLDGVSTSCRFKCCPLLCDLQRTVNDESSPLSNRGLPCNPQLAVPIRYQRCTVGFVIRNTADQGSDTRSRQPLYETIAAKVAHLAQRAELSVNARKQLGRELWLIGTSRVLAKVDAFLEQAALLRLPVLIRGEPGSGREEIARALHLLSYRSTAPFVKLDGSVLTHQGFYREFRRSTDAAEGGTLFLAAIDEMESILQSELADILRSGIGAWQPAGQSGIGSQTRVVASVTNEPEINKETEACRLYPALAEELDFLTVSIDPLRVRCEDIRHLTHHFIEHYARGVVAGVAPAVLEVFERYPWPGNIPELRRVVGRLVALARGRIIELGDLRSHVPHLLEKAVERQHELSASPPRHGRGTTASAVLASELVQMCAKGCSVAARVRKARMHPALGRAMEYLTEHVEQKILVEKLARHSCVSSSHLSHLFNAALATSPIVFLAQVRVERAKVMLVEEPALTITEIAGKVGFGDLRHFERKFKHFVGMTPMAFRSRDGSLGEFG